MKFCRRPSDFAQASGRQLRSGSGRGLEGLRQPVWTEVKNNFKFNLIFFKYQTSAMYVQQFVLVRHNSVE
jgi:hypothetical protein